MTGVLRLYPRWWRRRYGDEMRALLDAAPARRGDRRDLARGALDAWLHPPEPSHLPAVAALLGGGIWTMVAARVASQPVQPDWPGYLMEVVPFALVAAIFLLIAVCGIALRAADAHARATGLAIVAAIVGYGAWIVAMAGTVGGVDRSRRPVGHPDRSRWSRPSASASSSGPPTSDSARWSCWRPARCSCRGPVRGSSSGRAGRPSG